MPPIIQGCCVSLQLIYLHHTYVCDKILKTDWYSQNFRIIEILRIHQEIRKYEVSRTRSLFEGPRRQVFIHILCWLLSLKVAQWRQVWASMTQCSMSYPPFLHGVWVKPVVWRRYCWLQDHQAWDTRCPTPAWWSTNHQEQLRSVFTLTLKPCSQIIWSMVISKFALTLQIPCLTQYISFTVHRMTQCYQRLSTNQ